MSILSSATAQQVGRLLELFPIANIRNRWPGLKGNKDELCLSIAKTGDIAGISTFVDETLTCCKQHVYILCHEKKLKALPDSVVAGEKVLDSTAHALYLIRAVYKVYLSDPLEEALLEFLWPLRLELLPGHLVARFVVLEKALGSYFNRPYHLGSRSVDEDAVLKGLSKDDFLSPCDLHKGIKKLWAMDFMDCFKAKYRKPMSVASEDMDGEKGIKKHNPELYQVLRKSTLLSALFEIEDPKETPESKSTVSILSAEPLVGFLGFPRYTDKKGDTDAVLDKVLANN
jgi:hypothetical protein